MAVGPEGWAAFEDPFPPWDVAGGEAVDGEPATPLGAA
jgi:hypothetical protein